MKKPKIKPARIKQRIPKAIKNPKGGGGHPTKEIDFAYVRQIAQFQPTEAEMAQMCGIDYSNWKRRKNKDPRLQEAINAGKAKGCFSLRTAQMREALKGNSHMLKWCGMQYLGQKHAMQHGNDPVNPITPVSSQTIFHFDTPEEAAAAFENYIREGRRKPGK